MPRLVGVRLGRRLLGLIAGLVQHAGDGLGAGGQRRAAVGGVHGRIAVWDVPAPLEGGAERLRLAVEVLTGIELGSADAARPLDAEEVDRRRKRLDELGGAPKGWATSADGAVGR
jgi:hypothetical protein